jgi:dihydroneopterin aldolase
MPDDWIRVKQIRVFGHHGVYAEERIHGQVFETDVELCTDLHPAARADAVRDAIDYVEVYRVVERTVSGSPNALMETVAERIAAELLRTFPVRQVIVRMRKPRAKMPGPVGAVEIEIRRPRAE